LTLLKHDVRHLLDTAEGIVTFLAFVIMLM